MYQVCWIGCEVIGSNIMEMKHDEKIDRNDMMSITEMNCIIKYVLVHWSHENKI